MHGRYQTIFYMYTFEVLPCLGRFVLKCGTFCQETKSMLVLKRGPFYLVVLSIVRFIQLPYYSEVLFVDEMQQNV